MSIALRVSGLLAVVLLLASSAPPALSGERMYATAITRTFQGMRLDGVYADGSFFSESYGGDGTIRYFDAIFGADNGQWSVKENLFCTFYDRLEGACFIVVRDGANCFTFYERDEKEGRLVQRPEWTSRGWVRGKESTCPTKPEAVV